MDASNQQGVAPTGALPRRRELPKHPSSFNAHDGATPSLVGYDAKVPASFAVSAEFLNLPRPLEAIHQPLMLKPLTPKPRLGLQTASRQNTAETSQAMLADDNSGRAFWGTPVARNSSPSGAVAFFEGDALKRAGFLPTSPQPARELRIVNLIDDTDDGWEPSIPTSHATPSGREPPTLQLAAAMAEVDSVSELEAPLAISAMVARGLSPLVSQLAAATSEMAAIRAEAAAATRLLQRRECEDEARLHAAGVRERTAQVEVAALRAECDRLADETSSSKRALGRLRSEVERGRKQASAEVGDGGSTRSGSTWNTPESSDCFRNPTVDPLARGRRCTGVGNLVLADDISEASTRDGVSEIDTVTTVAFGTVTTVAYSFVPPIVPSTSSACSSKAGTLDKVRTTDVLVPVEVLRPATPRSFATLPLRNGLAPPQPSPTLVRAPMQRTVMSLRSLAPPQASAMVRTVSVQVLAPPRGGSSSLRSRTPRVACCSPLRSRLQPELSCVGNRPPPLSTMPQRMIFHGVATACAPAAWTPRRMP